MTKGRAKKRSRNSEAPCILRFCNNREGVTARVLWVDFSGKEKEYARLDELCYYNQDTYVNHPWRLRDAASGDLLAEYVGPTATITLQHDGSTHIEPGLHRPPLVEVSDPRWGTYRQRGEALGIPILAFDCVCQEAVETAAHIVLSMLADADGSIVESMVEAGAEVAIIGCNQVTTDLPMYRHLRGVDCENGGGDYDKATRGLGGNPGNPVTSCGEENLLMLPEDRYRYENILIHEFGHAVMDLGLHDKPLQESIVDAYQAAHASGRYDLSCYMMENESEYWAEGTQAWFDATVREDVTSGVNTRHKLQERDPKLAELMTLVYGDGDWRYPQTAPHKFAPCEESSERQHGQQAESSRSGAGAAMQRPMVQVVAAQHGKAAAAAVAAASWLQCHGA
ncbi:hypothetical protein CHLNCDRAFT_145288 [Chlorella variabilis]|uniref:von Hippel-Lindau disease tumour suppressor beta domain-containing protein n=1 Tax=Chlorella variabilis TaxID=554065 RepID=E1ZE41_CHLVA|nr:hypothetical protein CHLNCDRAFT_145288 [Chlorella variabilis]EFN55802.1 hypothetical protein CHLNCDRAFT_145288 [Chlorella variabilis]|eukprot:XP_005847904.1 hypothetical protein CHLNCDRAFT_145288 [Chlorella variabilis]